MAPELTIRVRVTIKSKTISVRYSVNNWVKQHVEGHNMSSSSTLVSRCVPCLGEGLSMPSPSYPVLCCLLSDLVPPVFVQVVSPPLDWSPLSSFLVIWSPSGDTQGPPVVFEAVDMPCPGPFHLSHIADYIYDFCLLPDPNVFLSILVGLCDVEHTSFHFGLCGRKFVLCLFNIFYQHIVNVYWGVIYNHHICLSGIHLKTRI